MAERTEMVVAVKAYPSISKRYGETVCVAGIRTDRDQPEWVRLFPVAFRELHYADRFKKYQRMTLDVTEASDPRPESAKPILDTINLGDVIKPGRDWRERRALVEPLMLESMCQMRELQRVDGRSLGIFRPAEVTDFSWEAVEDDWDDEQQAIVDQPSLFLPGKTSLEKIGYRFRYHYRCADPSCDGHKQTIVDWELAESYRSWRAQYPNEQVLLDKLRERWLQTMCGPERDTAFIVGNQFRNHDGFLVLGVFWPPARATGE
jgi:hypothetical protein